MSDETVNLDLTKHEAFILRALLDTVAGSPDETDRYYTESVVRKLIEKGVPYTNGDSSWYTSSGSIVMMGCLAVPEY